jgi:hypothetical protein
MPSRADEAAHAHNAAQVPPELWAWAARVQRDGQVETLRQNCTDGDQMDSFTREGHSV